MSVKAYVTYTREHHFLVEGESLEEIRKAAQTEIDEGNIDDWDFWDFCDTDLCVGVECSTGESPELYVHGGEFEDSMDHKIRLEKEEQERLDHLGNAPLAQTVEYVKD